ncbi:U-scoloptoxin(11)-Sm5a-like [Daphnia pulex]|uniref:U-scoloptoxin(11)-Sm5a-like n=1 Tax=Daphnia pulex TaxID=6669 RepID=UPI001EDC99BD|nr:U-scoloptoxin(11)-Sm5a-like [Daphnia pulex]XP_046441281.1 U-scoloptoxin(11)-Sm5a-like [Daphnia pulex]XP_046441282.1 U-scoloptoxin(11)-Sm5a-like [Daphnia pulex]
MYLILVRAAWFILTGLIMSSLAMGRMTGNNVDGNEINDIFQPLPEETKLPVCTGNTICAYLQANARGINTQPLCSCSGPTRCPLVWDNEDGHSITQGSDQYKYCRKAPTLRTCQRGMTAYTTVSLMSKSTGRMLSLNDVNHCICPGQSANYDLVDSQFDDVDDDTESMSTTYVCNALKTCGGSEACKVITETATTFLVNPKCRCAHDGTCPSSSAGLVNNNGGRKTETVRYGNGALHMIYCH